MLARIADLAVARRRIILLASVVVFALAGGLGGNVAEYLSSGGFDDPGSESYQADEQLLETFDQGVPNFVLVVSGPASTDPAVAGVNAPETAAAGLAITERLAAEADMSNVVSHWSIGVPDTPLVSDDGTRALVLGRILGSENFVDDRVAELTEAFEGAQEGGLEVEVTGFAQTFREVGEQIEHDLLRAEIIAVPITMLLLLFVFRGVVAAMLPLAIGALSVVSTFLVLRIINSFTEVSVFALNLTTAMGLGLAIDYSLFVVNRYREELGAGHEPNVAVVRTVRTAGRTIAFSAGTVAASLLALLVFPIAFLKSFAYAGVAVAGLAGLFSVVVLPAMLAALGRNVNKWPIRLPGRERAPKAETEGFWYRSARAVMRRPAPIATAVVVVLLFLGTPFLGIDLGLPDDRVLPEGKPARDAADIIREEFSSNEAGASSAVAVDVGDPSDPALAARIDAYSVALSAIELDGTDGPIGAERVDSFTGQYVDGELILTGEFLAQVVPDFHAPYDHPTSVLITVTPDHEPNSADGEAFAKEIRSILGEPVTVDGTTYEPIEGIAVTGTSALLVDSKAALMDRIPLAIGIIGAITFALLFLMFGSVVIPLKALVLNVLSLSATFGAMVWIFQDGNWSGFLDFTATGSIDATTPILMFCVAFGLSMDYEVFLLSRIKEEHDNGADDGTAVALGLERTGRIVTAAALLIAVVFVAFGTSEVRFIKLFGLGLALAVLMDAFVIRGTLVPAFMRLAGGANWWAPGPMRRFHDRFGVSEHVDLDGPGASDDSAAASDTVEAVPAADPRPRRERPLVAAGREASSDR